MTPEPDAPLEEDEFSEKVPSRYASYLEEDSFEKFSHRNDDWAGD